jgi:hypothetical protein
MKTLAIVNGVIFAIVFGLVVAIGFDLKKWHSWLFGVYGFLTFFLVGLVGTGSINEAIKAGVLFAFITMFGGAVMRWNQERAKSLLQDRNKRRKNKS